jgi:hypothetical protein
MMRNSGFWLLTGVLLVNAGCALCNRPPSNPPPPRPIFVPPPPPVPVMGQPVPVVAPAAAFGQPQAFPTAPPGPGFAPPSITPPGPGSAPPSMPPPPNEPPPFRTETKWQPIGERDASPRDVNPSIRLYAPEPLDKDKSPSTEEPPVARKPNVQGTFPPIPQFAEVKANVYAGLRPPAEGLDWLQANGVQTVVQILPPGENDALAQKQVEDRRMRYIAFEASPETLTKEKTNAFIQLIRDGAKQGIFVYDKDGSLAGGLWYLNLRWGEVLDDDAARIRAASFGLHNTTDGQYLNMWLAVQKLLSENNR